MPASQHCQPLPEFQSDTSMGDLTLDGVVVAGLYAECATLNGAWIDWAARAKAAQR